MNKPLDIFICAYLRPMFTEQTLIYLKERTKYPYRLFLIKKEPFSSPYFIGQQS